MKLSNRLAFPIASLILMLAIGLVFAPTTVLTHPHDDDPNTSDILPNTDGHLETDHPTATITLVDAKDTTSTTFTDDTIKGKSVKLVKTDGSDFAELRADDPTVDPQISQDMTGIFRIRIEFDKDLMDVADGAGGVLADSEISLIVLGQTNPNSDIGSSLSVGTPARVTDSKRAFEVEITVNAAQFAELPLIVFVTIEADAVSTPGGYDLDLGTPIEALGNLESTPAEARFEVVEDLSTVPDPDPSPVVHPDGTFEIPGNSFVVVVRNDDASQPGARGIHFRSDVDTVVWTGMPDLANLFDLTAPHGGGALIVESAGTAVGTVGISEIMWALDESYLGIEAAEKASQWIELHNLNADPVTVTMKVLMGTDITDANNGLRGDLVDPNVDAVTNFFNNRPGNAAWTVKGFSGDSVQARNFISMARILPDEKDAYANADGALYSNRDGRAAGNWDSSQSTYLKARTSGNIEYDYVGTPGRVNSFKPSTQGDIIQQRTIKPASNTIVINEVANRSGLNEKYEWIELRNVSEDKINLRNYLVSIVTAVDNDAVLIQFPADDNAQLAKNEVFLIVATDPADDFDHPLAVGYNVSKSELEQEPGTRKSPVRYMAQSFALPDDGNFVLMVREPDNGEGQRSGVDDGKGVAETGTDDLDKIVDIAGYHSNLIKDPYPNSVSKTDLWPLYKFDAPSFAHNRFDKDVVHLRQRLTTHNDRSGVGAHENKDGEGEAAFRNVGWTGVGYRRLAAATDANGGTPGYPNNALPESGSDITAAVYISEIMYADNAFGSLPQWIELRNPSKTLGADLHNWRLTIVNHDTTDGDTSYWQGKGEASILLKNLKIRPNSSVLITSRRAIQSEVFIPNSDIFVLWPTHRETFGMVDSGDDFLNAYGFNITLHANGHENDLSKWQLVDEIGNLASDASDRRGNRKRFDPPSWKWPHANTEEDDRISVARTNTVTDITDNGFTRVVSDGTTPESWILSSIDSRTYRIRYVFYGHRDDISTPGQTLNSPLPVSLSFFRPTLEDEKVIVRWTTESELDNAGFNILRSDTRNGEFKQVNEKLIQGNGTTGERSNYKWVDTSAKPGAVYYYRIEDISFNGERQTLMTTKLKGLISPENKLTTRWGELKSQD